MQCELGTFRKMRNLTTESVRDHVLSNRDYTLEGEKKQVGKFHIAFCSLKSILENNDGVRF